MRALAVAVLVAVAAPPGAAVDKDKEKDEDKAKEAATAFLKALKAKDVDAALKVSATPFGYRDGEKSVVLDDEAALKKWLKERIDAIKDADAQATEIKGLQSFAALKEKIADADKLKTIEDVIGKDGFVAVYRADEKMIPILIRMKDGKAKIVGVGR
jgi:hypothetical protein